MSPLPSSSFLHDDVLVPDPVAVEISRPRRDTVVVTPTGEVDGCTAPVLAEALDELDELGDSHERNVVVDLDRLAFMDSAMVNLLVRTRKRAVASGGTLAIRCEARLGRLMLGAAELDRLLVPRASRPVRGGATTPAGASPARP